MKELFAKCIPFDSGIKGRIGGNPPKLIEEQIPHKYKFYATLVHPEKEDKMLSILIHENFDTLIENNIYPNIEVKVIEHNFSEEGLLENKRIEDISAHSISEYKDIIEDDEYTLVRVGEPEFIQHKDYYYNQLINDGYSFLMQVDEDGYSDDLLLGDYPFLYGALYLYKHKKTDVVVAGFWQYS